MAASPVSLGLRPLSRAVSLAFIGPGRRHAAELAGFQIVTGGATVDEILADRSIGAVCIAVPGAVQAELTVRACQAGKDVYLETPVSMNPEDGRRMVEAARRCGRVVQAGNTLRSGAGIQKARDMVRRGDLGEVVFCRVRGGRNPMPLIDLVQFLFGEVAPVSLDAQSAGRTVNITFRYPGFIVSYQSAPGPWAVRIHGSRATLTVGGSDVDSAHVAHWRNFLECMRTRRRPAADIETCMPSATACLQASLAMRHNWSVA